MIFVSIWEICYRNVAEGFAIKIFAIILNLRVVAMLKILKMIFVSIF